MVEAMLPEIVAGPAEHAALLRERQRAAKERERQQRDAEARRGKKPSVPAKSTVWNLSMQFTSSSWSGQSCPRCLLT
jgi:hypothetical protein